MIQRKSLTLPSGATCRIRKFSNYDLIGLGDLYTLPIGEDGKKRLPQRHGDAGLPADRQAGQYAGEDIAAGAKLAKIALLRCVSALTLPDGSIVKIVEKPWDTCTDGETTIEELPQADADMLVNEILALSEFGKEAVLRAKPFPEKQETPADVGPNSPALRSPAEPPAEAIPAGLDH